MKTSIRRPYFVALISLFTDTLCLLFKVRRLRVIKIKTAGDLLTASADEGVVVREEENRQSVDISGSNLNLLFPGKVKYHWLNGDYPVIIMNDSSRSSLIKKILKPHKQFISPVLLVQFNWYCKRRGNYHEALTWGAT